ncbi:hypothetical protein BWI96_00460 [Siphonobacter sp. SORGH_AS_0500]|uniref:M61 family metallopeptidase n=1 Tax=Siphonobacter sp. SORGH_AS_0500 TaxID=1864824 RepID=UPI000CC8B747|nr:PDZ domain-containing protein [Siphonobacter sp. SORGH_AS_0500]PKK38301.1 hypothetical protein BWI96_00460 [Siphonobacter sp. SORGH_AS_0500]
MIQRLVVFVFIVFFLCGFVFVPDSMSQTHIQYTISMPEPATHCVEVEMQISDVNQPDLQHQGYIDLKMPVWTPGSYLIREYSKNVDRLEAWTDHQPTVARKIRKNVWRIPLSSCTKHLKVHYQLYANELTVRTNFLDDQQAYLTGAATFLYAEPFVHLPHYVTIKPFSDWKSVSTALPAVEWDPHTYRADHFDLLVDSPFQIGTHRTLHFEACGIPHQIAMVGSHAPVDEEQLLSDYKRICEAALTVVGQHPCSHYLFIVQHTNGGLGGLEHLHCTTLQANRNTYSQDVSYANFLGLVAHEYFHLWNVKRIRPIELGPFDYENENYTHLLWVAEGFTSMYDNHILRRAKLSSVEKYLADVASDFSYVANTPGTQIQSLTDASWDAWIKYYRPNENAINSQSSYYVKGAAVATLLNLEIIHATQGSRSLDDVMRYLYTTYYLEQNRGFSEEEIQSAIEHIAGVSFDSFFSDYIWGTKALNFNKYLAYVGCSLANEIQPFTTAFLGANVAPGKNVVSSIIKDSPAYRAGLNAGDELVSVNGQPLTDLNRFILTQKPNDELLFEVRRSGLIRTFDVKLSTSPLKKYVIVRDANPSKEQQNLFETWVWA